jgi:phage regulator Rha-like protein
MNNIIPIDNVEKRILMVQGHKVMIDKDLAELYGVETKVLIQAVKRNIDRFPSDFMFQLNNQEVVRLRSQFVTSKTGRGGRRYLPYVFTEQGVAMLSTVLKSERAIKVNIAIMRAFVKMRQMIASNAQFARKLETLEKKYDKQFAVVFEAINALMAPPDKKQKKIGFKRE